MPSCRLLAGACSAWRRPSCYPWTRPRPMSAHGAALTRCFFFCRSETMLDRIKPVHFALSSPLPGHDSSSVGLLTAWCVHEEQRQRAWVAWVALPSAVVAGAEVAEDPCAMLTHLRPRPCAGLASAQRTQPFHDSASALVVACSQHRSSSEPVIEQVRPARWTRSAAEQQTRNLQQVHGGVSAGPSARRARAGVARRERFGALLSSAVCAVHLRWSVLPALRCIGWTAPATGCRIWRPQSSRRTCCLTSWVFPSKRCSSGSRRLSGSLCAFARMPTGRLRPAAAEAKQVCAAPLSLGLKVT